ncbi:MAG: 2-phosphosulfolactate phosphatase [Bacteroidetes bacterium 47-18]|nr:MAG: 2-phosphosulfolactate phosphatase [Bacteroidetes bacterium 47-18]
MNRPIVETCLSPALLHLFDTEHTIVVIIDIFRATSTITTALANGAREVIPVADVNECITLKSLHPGYITAGERDGKVAPGLEYGNSPFEYPPAFIKDKTLALTTTNGTKLLHMVENADQIIIGSFLNLDAVSSYLIRQNKKVLLACAAWKDRVNKEDSLYAGAVATQLQEHFTIACDSTRLCMDLYEQSRRAPSLLDFLRDSNHYRRLSSFGLEKDMEFCTTPNQYQVVPRYNGHAIVTETIPPV